jgi:acyl-CoA synthetase (NDP forming)
LAVICQTSEPGRPEAAGFVPAGDRYIRALGNLGFTPRLAAAAAAPAPRRAFARNAAALYIALLKPRAGVASGGAAERINFPTAKIRFADILHKTEAGGVTLACDRRRCKAAQALAPPPRGSRAASTLWCEMVRGRGHRRARSDPALRQAVLLLGAGGVLVQLIRTPRCAMLQ